MKLAGLWISIFLPQLLLGTIGHAATGNGTKSLIGKKITSITFLTYNVLSRPIHSKERVPALLNTIRNAKADIIALQEVRTWFLRRLMRKKWARNYYPTVINGKVREVYGQFILSRFPIKRIAYHPLEGRKTRSVLILYIDINGQTMAVATAHLESQPALHHERAAQLQAIFSLLAGAPETVLLGDFNFGDGEEPESSQLHKRYVDLWKYLRPGEAGHTWDRERNRMAWRRSYPGEKSRRLDRILLRSDRFKPTFVGIVGNRQVAYKDYRIYPSDHFGLLGAIQLKESEGWAIRATPRDDGTRLNLLQLSTLARTNPQ